MTATALQRVVVRMYYDPALVARVYEGRPVDGLDADGRAMLTRVDRRAWGTDPYRRARTLQALLEEFPAAAAEVGVRPLDSFFGDRAFHVAIQGGTSLALAFGEWIAPRAGPVADIELALARARRGRPAPTASGELARAPHVVPVAVPVGTCARWEGLRSALGPDPVAHLLAGFRAPPRPVRSRGSEHLLAEHGPGGDTVSHGSEGLHTVLVHAARPRTRAALLQHIVRAGADRAEAAEILDGIVADGLLLGAAGTRLA